jgi:hypothetical protein
LIFKNFYYLLKKKKKKKTLIIPIQPIQTYNRKAIKFS